MQHYCIHAHLSAIISGSFRKQTCSSCFYNFKIPQSKNFIKTTGLKTTEQQKVSISDIHFLHARTVPRRVPKKRTQPIFPPIILSFAVTVIVIKTVPVAPHALPALVRDRVALSDAPPEGRGHAVRVQPEHLQHPPGVLHDVLQHRVPGLRLGLLVEVGEGEGGRGRRPLPAEHLRRMGGTPGEAVGAGDLGYVGVGMGRVLAGAAGR